MSKFTGYIKLWYVENYPKDSFGKDIKPTVTFEDVFRALDNYQNVYEVIGVADSVVRERIFTELAKITEQPYEAIYDQWLMCHD